MWTAVSITATILWEDLRWFCAATWQDDAESEPVVLHRSGTAPLNGADDPAQILRAVLWALEREKNAGGLPTTPQHRQF